MGDVEEDRLLEELRAELARQDDPLCRCMACCCPPGRGHNSAAYARYEDSLRAYERYRDALASGLSDAEAREEGWPTRCDTVKGVHSTPHLGCILR